jgi:DNA-binding NarL/FixJ family response regulator
MDVHGSSPTTGGDAVRVLLVDDQGVVRAGLRSLIESERDLHVVGEAVDAEEALRMAGDVRPDVVLMDLSTPGADRVEATRRITRAQPGVQVLVLTSSRDADELCRALDAGAVGFLLKDAEPGALIDAIRAVARGESPLDARAVRAMLDARRRTSGQQPLTPRERQVLELVAHGMTNTQIAATLHIAESTVKAHVGQIFRVIGVSDRTAAAVWVERHPQSSADRREPRLPASA